ncbi:MAG: OmpA family protein [Melioribacteraceae bacterium]|nr:OmpA family protein [Melioribacteraceae bacterium]
MKKYLITIALILTVVLGVNAQTATDSWAFGFGGHYPKYVNVNIRALQSNYGGYLSLQRNFSENFGLRLKGGYSHLEGEWADQTSTIITQSTNLITSDLDLMYYLIPCEPVSPYLSVGAGVNYRMLTNNATASLEDDAFGYQWNAGLGIEWSLSENWRLVTEFGYHGTSNSQLDGFVSPTENNGSDNYYAASLGLLYLFGKGEPSDKCEPCQGITQEWKDMTDYDRIEDMIKNYIPKEVIKEVVVEKPIYAISEDRLTLVGVNFDFNKSELLPESHAVLDKAVTLLKNSPDVRVEIQGYTDNVGTVDYNQKLSKDRAEAVKNYLVSKGISANRLSTVGYSENYPIADNSTAEGRAKNRRVVFRIIN